MRELDPALAKWSDRQNRTRSIGTVGFVIAAIVVSLMLSAIASAQFDDTPQTRLVPIGSPSTVDQYEGESGWYPVSCPNCRPQQQPYAPQTQQFAPQIMVPQTVMVPQYLQGVQNVPPRQPAWVFGQWRQNWLNAATARRRAWRTVPGYQQPIYGPTQPQGNR